MRTPITVPLGVFILVVGIWSACLAGQANMVQTHIGHVMTSFSGTPMDMGLLPTAAAEAKVAVQHAGLAAKSTTLAMMQTHAGHVLHAIDPTVVAQGPGLGYGLKKAAIGAATHAGLAGKAPEASAGVTTHSMHVNRASTQAAAKADEVAALAAKIRASSSLQEASTLAAEMQMKAEQIISGMDADKNGTISWDAPEGGLTQAQAHMELMTKAAGS